MIPTDSGSTCPMAGGNWSVFGRPIDGGLGRLAATPSACVEAGNAASTVRRRALSVGQHLDADLQQAADLVDLECSKIDAGQVTDVGIDSGYVKDCRPRSERSFEVVVGRILNENSGTLSLGFVRTIESNSAAGHRLKRRMSEQGPITDGVTVAVNAFLPRSWSPQSTS